MSCFYQDGLRFSCARCSRCCREEPGFVYLSRSDLTNLARWSRIQESEFIGRFCRWVPYYDGTEALCLNEKENFDCVFWNDGCSCYDARPVQCATYPFWPFLLESRAAWDGNMPDCPGVNSGELHASAEIEEKLSAYRAAAPVRRLSEE